MARSIGMARGALTPVFAQPLSLLADGLLLLRAVPSVDRYVKIKSGDRFVVFPPSHCPIMLEWPLASAFARPSPWSWGLKQSLAME